jgi:AcrR family transcriptional regulator
MSKNILEEIRKEQVINATKKLIIDKGYSNFSMKDVAAEMDMSTGLIYHYFENKDDLLLQVLKHSFREPRQRALDSVEPLPDFFDKISTYIDNMNEVPRNNPEFYIILLNYLGQVLYAPDTDQLLSKFLGNLRMFIDQILDFGQGQDIISEHHREGLSELLIAASMGIAFQHIVDPQGFQLDKALNKHKEMVMHYLKTCPKGQ